MRRSNGIGYANFQLSNRKYEIMNDFQLGLLLRDYRTGLYPGEHKGKILWTLFTFGDSALNLLSNLRLRHREKLGARRIVNEYHGKPWVIGGPVYRAHRQSIRIERAELGAIAQQRYLLRAQRRLDKARIWRSKVEASFPLIAEGHSMEVLAEKLGCSLRTAYRRLEKYRESEESLKRRDA